jgi:hypothetical protein
LGFFFFQKKYSRLVFRCKECMLVLDNTNKAKDEEIRKFCSLATYN